MNKRKKIAILTGAGMSAESRIKTFRDANGLWENHDIMEGASIMGWLKNLFHGLKFNLIEIPPCRQIKDL